MTQQLPRDDHAHDLIGALKDLVDPQVPNNPLKRIVLQIAISAMQLKRLIGHFKTGVRSEPLGHGAVSGRACILLIECVGRSPDHETRRLQFRCHIREPELQGLEIREGLSELAAGL